MISDSQYVSTTHKESQSQCSAHSGQQRLSGQQPTFYNRNSSRLCSCAIHLVPTILHVPYHYGSCSVSECVATAFLLEALYFLHSVFPPETIYIHDSPVTHTSHIPIRVLIRVRYIRKEICESDSDVELCMEIDGRGRGRGRRMTDDG